MSTQQPTIPTAPYPLHQLTTSELNAYRAELEHEIAQQLPTAAVVDDLRRALADVAAEEDDRAKIASSR